MAYINNTTASVSIGGVSIPGTQIKSITINEGISNGNNLTMGNSSSAEMEINLINVSKITTSAMRSYAPVSVSITRNKIAENDEDTIPFHRTWNYFYVTKAEVKRNGNTNFYNVKVTAMDAMCKFSNKQFPQLLEDTTLGSVFETICLDIGSSGQMFRGSDIEVPFAYFGDKKYRDSLETIAAIVGGYAYINEEGVLSINFLGKGLTSTKIGADNIYLSGVNLDASSEDKSPDYDEEGNLIIEDDPEVVKISGVVCEAGGAQFKAGNMTYPIVYSGHSFSHEFIEPIYSQVITKVKQYTPLALKWVGNPTLKIGSMIEVEDFDGTKYKTYIMDRTCHFDGSYYEEITSYKPTTNTDNNFEGGVSEEVVEDIAKDTANKAVRESINSLAFNVFATDSSGNPVQQRERDDEYAFCNMLFVEEIVILNCYIRNVGSGHKITIPIPSGSFGGAMLMPSMLLAGRVFMPTLALSGLNKDYTIEIKPRTYDFQSGAEVIFTNKLSMPIDTISFMMVVGVNDDPIEHIKVLDIFHIYSPYDYIPDGDESAEGCCPYYVDPTIDSE